MRDSSQDAPSSEESPEKPLSMSSTLGDIPPNSTQDPFLRAQHLMHLVSMAPSSFSSQERVDVAIAIYDAAMRLDSTRGSRETEADDKEVTQRQLDLITGDFRLMKEETTFKLQSLDSKLDQVLQAAEENTARMEKGTATADSEAQRNSARIEELHIEVTKLIKQIKELVVLINKIERKACHTCTQVPLTSVRPPPRPAAQEASSQARQAQRRGSPSPFDHSSYHGQGSLKDDCDASESETTEPAPPKPLIRKTRGRRNPQAPARATPPRGSALPTSHGDGGDKPRKEVSVDSDSDYWDWEDAFPMRKDKKRSGKADNASYLPGSTPSNLHTADAMYPNSGPWSGFPTQYTGYPPYYPGVPHTTNTTNIPHPVPYTSDPDSLSATSRLTASAKEFVPGGVAGPAHTVTPSPGFPLPQKKVLRISNPKTGEAVVLRPPDVATRTVYVSKPTQPERPLTKKERKRKAKLEAEEKQRQEEEEKETKRKAKEDERLKKLEAEEQKKRKEEERSKWEEEEKVPKRKTEEDERFKKSEEEEQKKRKEEEQSKWEEEFEKRRREIAEEVRIDRMRRKEEQHRALKGEKSEAKATAKEERRRLKQAEEADAQPAASVKELEKKKELPRFATTSTSGTGTPVSPPQIPGGYLDPLDPGRSPPLKTNEERFRASAKLLGEAGILQFAGSSPRTQDSRLDQDPSLEVDTLPLDPDDVVAEEGEVSQGNTVDIRSNHVAIDANSQLSKQMEQLLREMKDLKDEVRELRSLTQREDKKERDKSPYRESSALEAKPRTATAVYPYFIMKEGELDFAQGDVITLLDPPQDTPSPRVSGWLYGEINITKRGFFPGAFTPFEY
ncbi:hypothetical protein FRC04_011229 [Tulasnella sp. 424]|nr:hypothetical protein FRC04_011229 [Tulasnella sp. 424]